MCSASSIDVIVMAAGKGTRMRSIKPKVLQPLAGKPLLTHVVEVADHLDSRDIYIIYGYGGQQVQDELTSHPVSQKLQWVEQAEQLGTGHAVQQVLQHLKDDGLSIILSGDVPLIRSQTLKKLVEAAKQGMSLVTLELEDSTGYGRVLRKNNKITGVVEHKDATAEQHQIKEVNTGIYAVHNELLKKWLPLLKNDNAQQEYYLTDIVKMATEEGIEIGSVTPQLSLEVEGINDRIQLANLERRYQQLQAERLMSAGVHLMDPTRFDLRGSLSVGQDVVIDVNVIIEGEVELADGVSIGANCILKNVKIGANTRVLPFSTLEQAVIDEDAVIGPYARLRPGTHVAANAHVGNFVELKNTVLGVGSKANHLAYLGDTEIGEGANIGAGTITCNYDGVNKFKTLIGDNAFIGSNSSLVAPVVIEAGATIGAGSVITKLVPKDDLAVARAQQRNISGWQRPVKK